MRMKFQALARGHNIRFQAGRLGSVQARQTASINQAAAERSRVPAFPDSKTPFWPRLPSRRISVVQSISGVSKDRSNVIEQDASQRACQLIGTSSDRDSRDFGRENRSQSDDEANSSNGLDDRNATKTITSRSGQV
jgi:hypothetical protein